MDERSPQPLPLMDVGPDGPPPGAVRRGRAGAGAGSAGQADAGPQEAPLAFEQALAELERIVHELEGGELGLEESLRLYERGVGLVRRCAAQLDAAEARVKVLSLDDEGRPVLAPLQEDGP